MKEKYNIEPYNENLSNKQYDYFKAKKRVDQLKGFYWHFFWYLAVNIFITTSKVVSDIQEGQSFNEIFTDIGTYAVWMFWGIGIVFHAIGVFGKNLFLGKNWEERKVQELMEKEKQNWE